VLFLPQAGEEMGNKERKIISRRGRDWKKGRGGEEKRKGTKFCMTCQ